MSGSQEFDAKDFPHLREFTRGYLHQDMVSEYGSAVGAAKAYVADLNEAERKQLAAEGMRFRKTISDLPIDEINTIFAKLGAAMQFKSNEEVTHVLNILAQEAGSSRTQVRSE